MSQAASTKSRTEAIGKIKVAYRALYAMGILCLFMTGVIFTITPYPEIALISLLFGLLYLFLGLMVKNRSNVALIIALILSALNVLAAIANVIQSGNFGFLFLHMGILFALLPAQAAIKELKA